MRRAGISELKARLSEYLRAVGGGDEVLVTDRGRPVARLVPVTSPSGGEEDERLGALEGAGIVRRGTGRLPAGVLAVELPADPDASVRRALIEERHSSR